MQFTTRWMHDAGWICRHAETFWDGSGTICSTWYVVESKKQPGFYAFGTRWMLGDLYGPPVNQCGSKEDCLETLDAWEENGLNYWYGFYDAMLAAITSA